MTFKRKGGHWCVLKKGKDMEGFDGRRIMSDR